MYSEVLPTSTLGRTGETVTKLGYGAMELRSSRLHLLDGELPMDFMLHFTISHPDMHTTIVGTKNPEHLAANVAAASRGFLPPDIYEEAKRRFPAG